MKILAPLVLIAAFLATAASAANCPTYSYVLTNGQTADANQVMANFNSILTCANTSLTTGGVNSGITQLTGLTTPLSVLQGGTGQPTSPVISFNTRAGAVSLLSADVAAALGFTPINPIAPVLTNSVTITGPSATDRNLILQTAGVTRWWVEANGTLESGANAGSDMAISRFADPGTVIDTPFRITRSTGVVTLADGLTVTGAAGFTSIPTHPTATPGDNSTQGATTAFVQAAIGVSMPSGTVIMYAAVSAPTGYLICDGTSYLRATYPGLFAVIGTAFGSVDGTHFTVPDMRGQFARGFDNGRGLDPGRIFGSNQTDQMQGHVHNSASGRAFITGTAISGTANITQGGGNFFSDSATGSPVNDGTNGAPRTGLETRPTSVAMNYIIKT